MQSPNKLGISTLFILLFLPLFSLSQEAITLEDIFIKGKYTTQTVPGFNFQQDGIHYTRLLGNKIIQYNVETGKSTGVLFDAAQFDGKNGFPGYFDSYEFSSREKYILIATDSEPIYRRSVKAHYFVFDRDANTVVPLAGESKQLFPTFSPNDEKIAFVADNNLFYREVDKSKSTALTDDGRHAHIINGGADWVYEEEFSLTRSFEWSPDSEKIAFLRFDESDVPYFNVDYHIDQAYPSQYYFKYPKVGEKNSVVTAHIIHLDNLQKVDVELPNEELYIPRMNWTADPNWLSITTINREQNNVRLFFCKAKNGSTRLILDEKDPRYIEIHDNLTFAKTGNGFIWTSDKDGYNHIFYYKMNGTMKSQVTKGQWEVTSFYGYDETEDRIYFQAAMKSPLTRGIYSIKSNGSDLQTLREEDGTHSATFNPTFTMYTDNFSKLNNPDRFTMYYTNGDTLEILEDNADLIEIKKEAGISDAKFLSVPAEDGTPLNAYLIKPSNFDSTKTYPLFMYLYGGPGSQKALDKWDSRYYWWLQMLAQQGIIVACVDNRGTGARGANFKKMTYKKLGHYETLDQISAAKYLGKKSYIDENRIGIFGWSYGGYMSSLCLFKGNDVFKMAIAVAPVTNWKWYDSIYTERYMGTTKDNAKGYRENSPVYFADQLKGEYLLVHGTSDDNVHFQNTLEMINALILANKQFDLQIYPNNAHGINNPGSKIHLFTKMTEFIKETLN